MARGIAEFCKSRDEVVHLADLFDRSTPDVEWIASLRGSDWNIISGDTRIHRNPVERAAWHEAGLTAFFLEEKWSRKQFWYQAAELVRWWPAITRTAKECLPGSGFLLPLKGSTPKLIYTP